MLNVDMNQAGSPSAIPPDALESWKAVAAYLNGEIRRVIHWEGGREWPGGA